MTHSMNNFLYLIGSIMNQQFEHITVTSYKGWVIWKGYNDCANKHYYFVCNVDGEDPGLSFNTIEEAKEEIDNW